MVIFRKHSVIIKYFCFYRESSQQALAYPYLPNTMQQQFQEFESLLFVGQEILWWLD